MLIIDFHTHAFPDTVAEKALPALEKEANWKALLDGKLTSLLASMDRATIEQSVIASIATKPSQFEPILNWSLSIASKRIIPLPSIHPTAADSADQLQTIAAKGFKGIKLHPYYQDFILDEPRLFPIYQSLQDLGLILLCHTGFDIAFERRRICDPQRIIRVVEHFPRLKLVTSHMGAWEDWDEVRRYLLGKPIYMDVSWSFHWLGRQLTREFLLTHPQDYILFGTDSPWADQKQCINEMVELDLPPDRLEALMGNNARRILQ